jgi:uncharacterized damage-inducible protein DinB
MERSPTFETLRKTLDQGTRDWKKSLGEVSEEQIGWKPPNEERSIGGIFLHMIAWEAWWCERFVAGGEIEPQTLASLNLSHFFDLSANTPHPPAKPLEWYYDQMVLNRERCQLVFEIVRPETKIKRGETSRSVQWVFNHLINHDSYHGGQAVLLKSQFETRS